jgi:hypothetical protein
MALTDIMSDPAALIAGGTLGALFGAALVLGILIAIAVYVYFAIAWQTIAKRQNYKNSWFAWIPILNAVLVLELGGFHWAWIFLLLIPIAGWLALGVLYIISVWRIYEKEKYPGWFSLAPIVPQIGWILNMIAIGFVAWKPKTKAVSKKK